MRLADSVISALVGAAMLVLVTGVRAQLQSGTYLASTSGGAATNGLWSVDLSKKRATPLAVQGLNFAGVSMKHAFVEDGKNFLIAVNDGTGGHVYRVIWQAGWRATRLNTTPMLPQVADVVRIGSVIYVCGASSGSTATDSTVWHMSSNGGPPSVYVPLGTRYGRFNGVGIGSNLVAVGSMLHLFMFDAQSPTGAQHWSIDTTSTPPVVTLVGHLPKSLGVCPGRNLLAVQAKFDPTRQLLVVTGRAGDVLWRHPAGVDVLHRTSAAASIGCKAGSTHWLNAMAVDTDTGAVVLGDFDRSFEELHCDRGAFDLNTFSLPLPPGTPFNGLSYVGSPVARFAPVSRGCTNSVGKIHCSYANSLPAAGNTAFAFTLDGAAQTSALLIGARPWAFDLGPVGAPGCVVHPTLDLLVALQGNLLAFPLPASAQGASFYVQWLVFDAKANRLGIVVSDSRLVRL